MLLVFFPRTIHSMPTIPDAPKAKDVLGSWFTTLLAIDDTCLHMDTWQKVLSAFIKIHFSDKMCPRLRYISQIPMFIVPADACVGWMSYDYDPDQGNCEAPPGEKLCAYFKFYIVLFQVVIPLIVLEAIIDSYWGLLKLVVKGTYYLLRALCHELYQVEHRKAIRHKHHA